MFSSFAGNAAPNPFSAFANNAQSSSFFSSQPAATAGNQQPQSAFLSATPQPPSSAFLSQSPSPPPTAIKSAFATSPPLPPSAFTSPAQSTPVKPRSAADLRPPSHLIAPKPPAAASASASSQSLSAFPPQSAFASPSAFNASKPLSSSAAPFTPAAPATRNSYSNSQAQAAGGRASSASSAFPPTQSAPFSAFSTSSSASSGTTARSGSYEGEEEEQEAEGDDGMAEGGDGYGGAEEDGDEEDAGIAEEEAEIARLEEEKKRRKARFNSGLRSDSASHPAASQHPPFSSSTSAAKAAVARAAGLSVHFDDDVQADEDELYPVNASTRIRGLCTEMCPRKELLDRLESHTISVLELEPGVAPSSLTTASSVPFAVKKYRRAAAAQRLDPQDVRTEEVLLRTCRHLVQSVVDRQDVDWHEVHRFVTDRFRAVRSDFVCQGIVSPAVVLCLEWMARFHILAFDVLAAQPADAFDPVQNMEKLTQTLTSLRLLYRDNEASSSPFPTPHQPEMQGYLLLSTFNPNFHESYCSLPLSLQQSAPVQLALTAYNAMREDNYALFFSRLRSSHYLQCCLLLPHVAKVRARAVEVISRGYQRFPLQDLAELLCLDGMQETLDMLEWYGFRAEEEKGDVVFVTGGRAGGRQSFSSNGQGLYAADRAQRLLDSKRPSTKREAILTGMADLPAAEATVTASMQAEPMQSTAAAGPTTDKTAAGQRAGSRQQSGAAAPTPLFSLTSSSSASTTTGSAHSGRAIFPAPSSSPHTVPTLHPAPGFFADGVSSGVRLNRDRSLLPAAPSFPSMPAASVDAAAPLAPPPRTSPRHAPPSAVAANLQFSPPSSGPSSSLTRASPFSPLITQPPASASFSSSSAAAVPPQPAVSVSWSPHRAAASDIASHPAISPMPLLRSLSTQQREEQQRAEAEQQRLAEMTRAAHHHHCSRSLRRWLQAAMAVRRQRERWQSQHQEAGRWHDRGLAMTAFLHWHATFCAREQRRVKEGEMRRMMSEDQPGLSAVHSGLTTQQQKVRQLLGLTAPPALQPMSREQPPQQDWLRDTEDVKEEEMDGVADEDEDDDMSDGSASTLSASSFSSPSVSTLDIAALVQPTMEERNPGQSQLFFHILLSVDSAPSPFADLLRQKLSKGQHAHHTHATRARRSLLLSTASSSAATALQPFRSAVLYSARSPLRHPAPSSSFHSSAPASPSLHVQVRQHVSTRPAQPLYTGYQGVIFLLSSPLGVEDLPSLVAHPEPTSAPQSPLVLPPSSRFESDRERLSSVLSSLHRHSRLALVVLYPLSASSLYYLHRYGASASDYFQQQAALTLTHALQLTAIDPQLVADASLSPLFLPSNLLSPAFAPSPHSLFSGYNDDCLTSALLYLAAASPPHPVLHRIDVPSSVEAKVQHCVVFLQQLTQRIATIIPSLPAFSLSRDAAMSSSSPSSSLFLSFCPQLYVDHFNSSVREYRRRLFSQALKELSWPPAADDDDAGQSSSSASHVDRMRTVLACLPLPAFATSADTCVLDWSSAQCHAAIASYLSSFRSLSAATAAASSGDDEQEEEEMSLGSDLYSLYHKAEQLFSAKKEPSHWQWRQERSREGKTSVEDVDMEEKYSDGAEQQQNGVEDMEALVARVSREEREERLRCWQDWLESLIQHRLSELLMHPVCIQEDQHVLALASLRSLTAHTDTAQHSHALPPLPPSPPPPAPAASSLTPHASLLNGSPAGQHRPAPSPVKRRKVETTAAAASTGRLSNGSSSAVKRSSKGHAGIDLVSALDEERQRQQRLSALLSELEAQWT